MDETVAALELVGATEHADTLERVISIVKLDPEGATSGKLNAMDDNWYATDTPDVDCKKYIKAHPEEFAAR